jgi:hypothetical protein
MGVKVTQCMPIIQTASTSRSEEGSASAQRSSLLPHDHLELGTQSSEKRREWCLMRCVAWVYDLFASLFQRFCCRTENKGSALEQNRDEPSSTLQPEDVRVSACSIEIQEVSAESTEAPQPALVKAPVLVLPDSLEADLLPAQKACLFFKVFAAHTTLAQGAPREAFISLAKSGKPGMRAQLWILHQLACRAQTDLSYEWVIKSYLVGTEISDSITKELGEDGLMSLKSNHFQQLPEVLRRLLGIENLQAPKKEESVKNAFKRQVKTLRKKPETQPVYSQNKDKSVENALNFTHAYIKESSNTRLEEQFKSQTALTQLCILYQLLPEQGAELLDLVNDEMVLFLQEERCLLVSHEYAQLKETFQEIIKVLLPDALVQLDQL